MRVVVVVEQRRGVRSDDQHDVAAVPAVGAVGTAQRLELLAADRRAAVAAVASADVQDGSIDERGHAGCLSEAEGGSGKPARPRRWCEVG